jgi:hypothetical protein
MYAGNSLAVVDKLNQGAPIGATVLFESGASGFVFHPDSGIWHALMMWPRGAQVLAKAHTKDPMSQQACYTKHTAL